jgi:tetratricopeptide (TPR) repeat protein
MEAAQHAKRNELLRRQRQQRGWSLQRVADEIRLLCERDGRRVGITAHMVGTWERGNKKPSPLYREKLCVLYSECAERLGLIDAVPHVDPVPLLQTPGQLFRSPGQLPAGGADDTISLDDAGLEAQDSEMRRRTFLRRLAGATGVALLSPPLGLQGSEPWERLALALYRPTSVDATTARDLELITANYTRLTESVTSGSLIAPVLEHLRTITDLLRSPQPAQIRRRLFVAAADAAQLAGRLLFGTNQLDDAQTYYSVALDAAREAGDHALAAYVIGTMSFIPARGRKPDKALQLVQEAQANATERAPATLRSWLSALEAEHHASLGNAGSTRAALDRAERAADQAEREAPPAWIDYFDRGRLAGFVGICHVRLDRPREGRAALDEALRALPSSSVKHRSVLLTDMATAMVKQGELDEGCHLAAESLRLAATMKAVSAMKRLRDFHAQLAPWGSTAQVRQFDEQLRVAARAVGV